MKSLDIKTIGESIRRARKLKGLSIARLAELVDKSTNYIGQIERGEETPSLTTLVDISNILDMSIDSAIGGNLIINTIESDIYIDEINKALLELAPKQRLIILKFIEAFKYV